MKNQKRQAGTIKTVWEVTEYEVWGNEKDGYIVNNAFRCGTVELEIPKTIVNAGTEYETTVEFPTNAQIREALKIKKYVRLHIDDDGYNVEVAAGKDYYPVGNLRRVSKSISNVE